MRYSFSLLRVSACATVRGEQRRTEKGQRIGKECSTERERKRERRQGGQRDSTCSNGRDKERGNDVRIEGHTLRGHKVGVPWVLLRDPGERKTERKREERGLHSEQNRDEVAAARGCAIEPSRTLR